MALHFTEKNFVEQGSKKGFVSNKVRTVENLTSAELQNVVDTLASGDTLVLFGTFNITSKITVNKNITIVGNGSTFLCNTNGLDNLLDFDGCQFKLENIRFNSNLKGRTSINVTNCTNFEIEKCHFTGYSKEFGYTATDGGIRINNSFIGNIHHNVWYEHGNQYDATTTDLNRCVTVQSNSDFINVTENIFYRVNQGIVVASGSNNIFSKNRFTEVRDNCVYAVQDVKGLILTDNSLFNCEDEGFVVSGENIIITNNNFNKVSNGSVVVCEATKNLTVKNNNIVNGYNYIRTRSSYFDTLIENVLIEGNNFSGAFGYAVVELGLTKNLKVIGNTFSHNTTLASRFIIKGQRQITNLLVKDNNFEMTSAPDSNTFAVDIPTGSGKYSTNTLTNCRIKMYDGFHFDSHSASTSNYAYSGGVSVITGAGSPEGVVNVQKGSIYLRTDTSSTYVLYVKSIQGDATGWVRVM